MWVRTRLSGAHAVDAKALPARRSSALYSIARPRVEDAFYTLASLARENVLHVTCRCVFLFVRAMEPSVFILHSHHPATGLPVVAS